MKIIVLIPPFLQPLQIIRFLLLIKDAVTPSLTTFMKKGVEAIPAFLLFKKAGTSITTLTTCMTDVVGALTRLLDLLKPQLVMKENITTINYIDSTTCATAVKYVEEEGGMIRPLKLQPTVKYIEEEGGLKSSTKEEELKTNLATTTNETNEHLPTSDSFPDNDTTVTYRFNGFAMKLDTTQATLHTSPDLDESTERTTDDTLTDKPDFDNERNTRTQLELRWKKILTSASDALCTHTSYSNQPKISPPTTIQGTQQWTEVTPRPHTITCHSNNNNLISTNKDSGRQANQFACLSAPDDDDDDEQPFYTTSTKKPSNVLAAKLTQRDHFYTTSTGQPSDYYTTSQPSDSHLQPNHYWTNRCFNCKRPNCYLKVCNKTRDPVAISYNKHARIMEIKNNNKFLAKQHSSSNHHWKPPSPDENNQRTIYGKTYIWEINSNGHHSWNKLKQPKNNVYVYNLLPTNISKSKHPITPHKNTEAKAPPTNIHGLPWTPDDLSKHLTTATIAAAVSPTLTPIVDDNTVSTVATSITEDNGKERKKVHQSIIKKQINEINRIQLQMNGLRLDNNLKTYNQTKRPLNVDPSLSYNDLGAEPTDFILIYKRIEHIQKQLKTQKSIPL